MAQKQSSERNNGLQILVLFAGAIGVLGFVLLNGDTKATEAPLVFFESPANNATVPTTFTVEMGSQGVTVEPAGEVHEGGGHFHILIDTEFIEAGEVVPNDEQHRHFGNGATETELTLEPGTYILRLQFANGTHQALTGDEYRDEITITVVEDD